jgi:hypothetical protein
MSKNEFMFVFEVGHLDARDISITVSLRDASQDGLVSSLLTVAARKHDDARAYAIKWLGDRVPRGVEMEGKTIGWTQHGVVLGGSVGIVQRQAF